MNSLSKGTSERESISNWKYILTQFYINKKRENEKEMKSETDFGHKLDIPPNPELDQLNDIFTEDFVLRIRKEEPNLAFVFLCNLYKIMTRKEYLSII
jgi:hypothetical protein